MTSRRVTAPTVTTLLGIGTHAVPDLTEEQRTIVHRCLKDYDAELSKQRSKLKNDFGIGDELYTPIDRQIDIMRGVVTNDSFGKRVGGLLDMFRSDSDTRDDQLEIQARADDAEREATAETGGMLKRHIEHSDGPPRVEPPSVEPPSVDEIEQAATLYDPTATRDVILATIAPDDIDADALLARVETWSHAQCVRVETHCAGEAAAASDHENVERTPIPRALYEALIATSEKYRAIAAAIPAERIDDTPETDPDGRVIESADPQTEASHVEITSAQLEALRTIGDGEGWSELSQSMKKKLAALKVVRREKGDGYVTALGHAVLDLHDDANETDVDDDTRAAEQENARDADDASDERGSSA